MLPKPKKARRLCAPPPNRAPPPLCLFCHPPRHPRVPLDTVSLATLHLYLPNGEFVVEVIQRHDQSVNEFLEKLENGHITPDLHLGPSIYSRPPEWAYYSSAVTIPSYVLVFNDIVLEECYDWVNVPGVSFTEPNNITVVRYERPVHPVHSCGCSLPRRRLYVRGLD